jgi:hypothetical protein
MKNYINRRALCCISLCLLLLLAACGSSGNTTGNNSNGANGNGIGNGGSHAGTSVAATKTVQTTSPTMTAPQPQTNCPATGQARTPFMPATTLGQDQNIVYIANTNQGVSGNVAHSGTLERYDVTTGVSTNIVQPSNAASINDAQISADGQWIVFSATVGQQQQLELVRVDGKDLQTLFCGSSIYDLQWSVNQQLLAFVSYDSQDDASDFYLLHMQNGTLQRIFHPLNDNKNGIAGYSIMTWLGATRLYVLTQPLDQPAATLSLLDITRGNDQNSSDLQQVFQVPQAQSGFCWSGDSSYDGSKLFLTQCQGGDPRGGGTQGPSTLNSEAATGGTAQTLYSSQTLALTTVRVVSANTLLLIVGNAGQNADTSHNGLWKIQTDGSGLTQLTSGGPSLLNQYNQYPWSNLSRNGNTYAVQQNNTSNKTISLLYGPMNGGNPTTFATASNSTVLSIVGWTTD